MAMLKPILLATLVTFVAACGGTQKAKEPDNPNSVLGMKDSGDNTDRSGNMISPDKMDEVQQALKRKSNIISQCLAVAMENKEVKRGTHGRITFEITVAPSGHASSVKVDKTDLETQSVIDCAKKHVEEVAFPELPKAYETSYTYAMEAN
jgi:hypothetical protein